jgi:hypothetical protein
VATTIDDPQEPSITAEPHPVPPAGSPELTSLLNLAVAAIVIATLYLAQDVVIPVVLAIMVSFVLSPIVSRVEGIGVPRPPAVLLGIVLTFGVVAGVATLLGEQATTLVADAPRYAITVEEKLRGLERFAYTKLGPISGMFRGTSPPADVSDASGVPGSTAGPRPDGSSSAPASSVAATSTLDAFRTLYYAAFEDVTRMA